MLSMLLIAFLVAVFLIGRGSDETRAKKIYRPDSDIDTTINPKSLSKEQLKIVQHL